MIKVTIPTLPEHLGVVTKSLMIKVTIPTLPEHLSALLLEFDDKG